MTHSITYAMDQLYNKLIILYYCIYTWIKLVSQ